MRHLFPKIVLVAAHQEAQAPFKFLISSGECIAGLFTLHPSRHAKMSGAVDLTPLARSANVPVYLGSDVNALESVEWIRSLAPDVLLVIGWTQLLKDDLLSLPTFACLGFHASLLPKYRGRAPINWALINGEAKTGNTMLVLAPGADEGDIVAQRSFSITLKDDCATLYQKVSYSECDMLAEILPLIREGRMPRRKQISAHATVMSKRRPEDGLIDWSLSRRRLYDWVRALTHPYPGAFTFLSRKKVTIWKAGLQVARKLESLPAGTIEIDSDSFPVVALHDGFLKLLSVQLESQSELSGEKAVVEFLTPGSRFTSSIGEDRR